MGRKIGFGILWFIAIFFVANFATGFVIGFIEGARAHNLQNGRAAARENVIRVIDSLQLYYFIAAVAIATIGAWKGFLPGTKTKPKTFELPDDLT